jgi:hypothetical protein
MPQPENQTGMFLCPLLHRFRCSYC